MDDIIYGNNCAVAQRSLSIVSLNDGWHLGCSA